MGGAQVSLAWVCLKGAVCALSKSPSLALLGSLVFFWLLEMAVLAFVGHSHGSEHVAHTDDGADKEAKHSLPRSTGWLNLCAEVVHNFLDGLAIGVAFSTSNSLGIISRKCKSITVSYYLQLSDLSTLTGVSTAIAVGAHELPQELGDFAVPSKLAHFKHARSIASTLASH